MVPPLLLGTMMRAPVKTHNVMLEIEELTLADPRIVFLGSDLGCGMFERLRKEAPDRFFMEGVSEQHLIGMAAGLAKEGFIPFVMTIATFLTRRCLEQIVVDTALHGLPVRLLGSGTGLAYAALGPTHIAVDDFALLRPVPGMTVLAPAETVEANALLDQSVDHHGPLYMRLPRGSELPIAGLDRSIIGRPVLMREPGPVLLVSTGQLTFTALAAHELLLKHGISAGVVHAHTVKPLDGSMLAALARRVEFVVTVEEHLRIGGLGSALLEVLHDAQVSPMPAVIRCGVPDEFVAGYGLREQQLEKYRLTAEAIADAVLGVMRADRPAAPALPHGPADATIPARMVARNRARIHLLPHQGNAEAGR